MGFHLISLRLSLSFVTLTTFLVCFASLTRGQTGTTVGFYNNVCPQAESIVTATVQRNYKLDPSIAPKLLRMEFHDCFVRGCDGSILLDGPNAEKTAIPNLSLAAAFPVIEEAKKLLEAACPGIVSCADILALAARDSVVITDNFILKMSWPVPTGRRDGRVSLASDTANLPAPSDSVPVQIQKFSDKGLNITDLVTLVGAHTIGKTDCQFFSKRLYNFSGTGKADPSIDVKFLPSLRTQCPNGGNGTVRVALDPGSETRFDNQYFKNIIAHRAVLESDQRLLNTSSTNQVLQKYVGIQGFFGLNFKIQFRSAMVKMSNAGVLTGSQGEIRKVCNATN
ncbi:hypothetical protein CASFOL_035832 [Castilleja foliolosa]|uniref:Peroxidase n=1 Tax=Castilleja foliolosa TaxID=1961234 RepID=A0ABD3BW45_9LAMI